MKQQDSFANDFISIDTETSWSSKSYDSFLKKRNISLKENQFSDQKSPDYIKQHTIQKRTTTHQKQYINSFDLSSDNDNQKQNHYINLTPHKYPQENSKEISDKNVSIDKSFCINDNEQSPIFTDNYPSKKNPINVYAQLAKELADWTTDYLEKQKNLNKRTKPVKKSTSQRETFMDKEFSDETLSESTGFGNSIEIQKENFQAIEQELLKADEAGEVSEQSNEATIGPENGGPKKNKAYKSKQHRKDYIKAYKKKYYAKNRERENEYSREWYRKNRAKQYDCKSKCYWKDGEREREYIEWYMKNKAKHNDCVKKCSWKDKDMINESDRKDSDDEDIKSDQHNDFADETNKDTDEVKTVQTKRDQKEYRTQYYQKNREKAQEKAKEYHAKNREKHNECAREYGKRYYQKNKEKMNKFSRAYYMKNKEKICENCKKYNRKNTENMSEHDLEYAYKNREKRNTYRKEYVIKNKEKLAEYRREYYWKNKENMKRWRRECYKTKKEKQITHTREYHRNTIEALSEQYARYKEEKQKQFQAIVDYSSKITEK